MRKYFFSIVFFTMSFAFSTNAQQKYAVLITGDYAGKNIPENE